MNISVDDRLAKCGAFAYDCEIYSAVPQHGEPRDPDLHYCEGWDDHVGMGISVVTAYDFVDRAYRIYLQDNLDELKTTINSRGVIIGFSNHHFDDRLLAANKIHIPKEKSYDLWVAVSHTIPDGPGTRRGLGLNELLKANNMESKSGSGAEAPRWVQTGKWGRCINYCLDDTRLLVQLLRLACADVLKSPKTGSYIKVQKPWELSAVEEGGLFS